MDKKSRVEEMKEQFKQGLEVLENTEIDEITDEDLDDVSGGLCSGWCCSNSDDSNDSLNRA